MCSTRSIYCGLCGDGPFTRAVAPPTSERVIEGYYFCGWCYEYTDWNRLRYASKDAAFVARAKALGSSRAYPTS